MKKTIFTLRNKYIFQSILIVILVLSIGAGISQGIKFTQSVFDILRDSENDLRAMHERVVAHSKSRDALISYIETGDEDRARAYEEGMTILLGGASSENFSKASQLFVIATALKNSGDSAVEAKRMDNDDRASEHLEVYLSFAEELNLIVEKIFDEEFYRLNDNVTIIDDFLPQAGSLIIAAVALAALLVTLFSALIIFPTILHLQNLLKVIERYSAGNLATKAIVHSHDEVGQLSYAFNNMSTKLAQRTRDLEKLNENLNEKVAERTASLEMQKRIVGHQADRLDSIIEAIGEGVIVVDDEMTIQKVNEEAARIVGYSEEIITQGKFSKFFPITAGFNGNTLDFNEIFTDEKNEFKIPAETILKTSAGRTIVIGGIITRNRVGDSTNGYILVIRDITKEHNLNKIKSEFASMVSHQMRAPLTHIKWESEFLIDELGPTLEELHSKHLNEIHNHNERLISLVNNFLRASKLDLADPNSLKREQVNISSFLSEIIGSMEAFQKEHQVRVVLDVDKNASIYADKEQVREVYNNLINNAIKYSKKDSIVEVTSEITQDGKVTIHVKDSGIGIPEEDQERIFGKFFRAENAKVIVPDGNGLGLYIVKAIVKLHNGNISFDSTKSGTTFTVTIPSMPEA